MDITINIDDLLIESGYTKVIRCRDCEYVKKVEHDKSWTGNRFLYVCTRKVYNFSITGDDYCCMGRKRKQPKSE